MAPKLIVRVISFELTQHIRPRYISVTDGRTDDELIAKFDAFFKKAVNWGYSCELKRLSGLLHEADAQLFRKVVNNKEHCIHQLLPPEKILPMKLRASNCIFALPRCQFNLYKRSFVLRSLFEDAY